MKVLVLEDENEDFKTLQSALGQYLNQYQNRKIELVHCKDTESFEEHLENDKPEGIICDIRLIGVGGQEENGMQILGEFLKNSQHNLYLIPAALLTKLPNDADEDPWIPVFTKEKGEYPKLFDHLWDSHQTGIREITGVEGAILGKLKDIFSYAIAPHFNVWKEKIQKGKTSDLVKKSLQRHILSHLLYELSEAKEQFQPEEFFLYTKKQELNTGRIFKQGDNFLFLITPPCNLAQNCRFWHLLPIIKISSNKKEIKEYKILHKHYIPALKDEFEEGCIDFINVIVCRDLTTYTPTSYQVSPEFVKNIQSRFAAYYARQGQPDMDL